MGGGDSGCGIGLLGVTFSYIPQTEQHEPFVALGNVLQISGMTFINGGRDSAQGFSVKLGQCL